MMAPKHVIRRAFLILLCVAGIALALWTMLQDATNANSLFSGLFISWPLANFFSGTLTGDSEISMGSAKRMPLKILMAPAPDPVPSPSPSRPPQDELDTVLAKTANVNKTLIITALNGAWAEPSTMIDLFLKSFHVGEGTQELLNNLLIVALDAKAYNRCLQIHPRCYSLKTRGVDFSEEKLFMSKDYLKMMWRRLGFLAEILESGYNIVFSMAGVSDMAYHAAFQEEDPTGTIGVNLSKHIMEIAAEALQANMRQLGPLCLPYYEQILYLLSRFLFYENAGKGTVREYVPNFKRAFNHICIHSGGKAVIRAVEKGLKLPPETTEPSNMTLYRFGNTSSSSSWYQFQYLESKGRMKKEQKIWQICLGSGFKCNSAVWVVNTDIAPPGNSAWSECILDYPVQIPEIQPLS